jgi:hypothetical protein
VRDPVLRQALALAWEDIMDADLAARVTRLEARFAVLEAIAQLTTCWDAQDAEGYADAFTETAVFEAYAPDAAAPLLHVVGRTAIAAWAQGQFQGLAHATQRHLHSDPEFVQLTEDAATVRLTEVVLRHDAEATVPQVTVMLRSEMTWERVGATWRASHGILHLD